MSWISIFAVFICLSTNSFVKGHSSTRNTVRDILRRLDELELQNREQQTELDNLKTENTGLHESNVAMQKEIERLNERDSQLTDRIKLLEGSEQIFASELGEESKSEADSTENDRKVSKGYLGKALSSVQDSAKRVAESELSQGHNRIRQLEQGSTIAFLATRSSSHADHLGQHQAVVFDRIITNVGQAYHNSTGTFIAPVSGIYVFSVSILAANEAAHFQFTINGYGYTMMYAHGTETYETISQTVVFKLSKGDDVAIQSVDLDKFVHGYDLSTFSGFLLASIEGDIVVG